jgi:hypothetical protein
MSISQNYFLLVLKVFSAWFPSDEEARINTFAIQTFLIAIFSQIGRGRQGVNVKLLFSVFSHHFFKRWQFS